MCVNMSAGVFHIVVAASADIFALIVVPVAVFCMFARADSTKSTRITNKTNERKKLLHFILHCTHISISLSKLHG